MLRTRLQQSRGATTTRCPSHPITGRTARRFGARTRRSTSAWLLQRAVAAGSCTPSSAGPSARLRAPSTAPTRPSREQRSQQTPQLRALLQLVAPPPRLAACPEATWMLRNCLRQGRAATMMRCPSAATSRRTVRRSGATMRHSRPAWPSRRAAAAGSSTPSLTALSARRRAWPAARRQAQQRGGLPQPRAAPLRLVAAELALAPQRKPQSWEAGGGSVLHALLECIRRARLRRSRRPR
mmetsp:Transcript_93552/g.302337  ORF Transcript_93552/g.302337 Transcript_93552/m.302337 type:complete len:239 (+) Transcript_93552:838-1554(+)